MTVSALPRHYFFDPDPSVSPEVVAVVEKAVAELEGLGGQLSARFPSPALTMSAPPTRSSW